MVFEESQGTFSKAINAGKWSIFGFVAQKILSLGTFFILARLLSPTDYGVITVVLMFVGVLGALSMPGFEKAMIQAKGKIDDYIDVTWTFIFFRSWFLALLIFLFAPLGATFFHITDAASIWVLRLSGLIFVISALGNMGNFFFFRELNFKKLFIRDIVGQIAFLVVAIPWALVQPSVVALFAGHLAQTLASILVTYALHEHRPRFSFYFKRLKDLSSYGSWVMAQNVLMQANSIVESTVVGRILGPRDLGLYSRANSVASLPSSAIMTVIYKVGFPAYARVQDSKEKVAQGFVKSYDVALSTLLPFLLVIVFAGGPLVGILLGSQWVDMVLAMKILVVSLTLEALSTITYPILEGIGKVDVRFKLSLLQIVLTLPLMYLFADMFGIAGAALGVAITSLIVFSVSSYWALRSLSVRISDISNSILIILAAHIITLAVAWPFYSIALEAGTLIFLTYLGFLGLLYLGALTVVGSRFPSGPYHTIKEIVKMVW